jgi:hypothetical protein
MGRVVIGMDPHKRSATIEALDAAEQPLMAGRFGTDREGRCCVQADWARRPGGRRVYTAAASSVKAVAMRRWAGTSSASS